MSGLLNIGSRAASVRSCHKKKNYSSIGSSSGAASRNNSQRQSVLSSRSPRPSTCSTVTTLNTDSRKSSCDSSAVLAQNSTDPHSKSESAKKTLQLPEEKSFVNQSAPPSPSSVSENSFTVPSLYKKNSRSAPTSPLRSKNRSLQETKQGTSSKFHFKTTISNSKPVSPSTTHLLRSPSSSSSVTLSESYSLDDFCWESETWENRRLPWFLRENSDNCSASSSFVFTPSAARFRRNSFTPSTATASVSRETSTSSLEEQEGIPGLRSSSVVSPTSLTSFFGLENFYYQIAVDDRRQLFAVDKLNVESDNGGGGIMASYGSIAYQMRDANIDATGMFDFVYKAFKILGRTVLTTLLLVLCMAVPLLMVILGIQFLHECPVEPNIPIYLLVGGCFGTLKGLWLICQQVRSRRYERIDDAFADDGLDEIFTSISYRATDVALSLFLMVWFGLGNYWVYRIYVPKYEATLFEPNDWCSRTVYLFAIAQLLFVYSVAGLLLLITVCLSCWQRCVTCFGEQYK